MSKELDPYTTLLCPRCGDYYRNLIWSDFWDDHVCFGCLTEAQIATDEAMKQAKEKAK